MTPGTSAWRKRHWDSCGDARLEPTWFTSDIRLAVAYPAIEAFTVLFDTMAAHRYPVRSNVTGAYNCRKITGGSTLSSHAYGIAVDVNWDTNPYVKGALVTDMPRTMTDDIQKIETVDGVRVWRWGGDWDHRPETDHSFYDAMHFEIIATPEELRAGITRRITQPHIRAWPTLRRGAKGPAVVELQTQLEIEPDGVFGPQTRNAVVEFQGTRGLLADGIVGPATWTALYHHLPKLLPGDIGPNKNVYSPDPMVA